MQRMITSWKSTFMNYAKFSGRASRHEFWTWILGWFVICFVLVFAEILLFGGEGTVLAGVFELATLVPGLAVMWRRLQDSGKSGWLNLVSLIPAVGGIIAIVFWCQPSQPGSNAYGPNPYGA